MARMTICAFLTALHGTREPRESTFDVEVTLVGPIKGDYVAGRDDRQIKDRVREELSLLEGTWLDDAVGRATLENIAAYLATRLRDEGIEAVAVGLRGTRVEVGADDLPFELCESELAFKRGISLYLRGRIEEALEEFTTASRLAPQPAKALNARGRCLRRLCRFTEAVADFDHAIALDPMFGEAHRNRGNVLLGLGRLEDAIADFTRAVGLMPESALACNNRGFAYQQARVLESALADHDKAIELDPEYEEAFRDRAAVLAKLGKTDLADRDLAHAESLRGMRSESDIERAKLMGQSCQLADRCTVSSRVESSRESEA